MNATSLYVSTCRLVMQGDVHNSSWCDLYRLLPYLRQSLACTVCHNLLIEPYTPADSKCQHHVCKMCKGGKKRLKPSCSWCKDYDEYYENIQLRILLQCFKKLCEYMSSTVIYMEIQKAMTNGCNELIDIIREGAGLRDEYKTSFGLSKSAYSILPCVFAPTASAATQTTSTVLAAPFRGKLVAQQKKSVTSNSSVEASGCSSSEATLNTNSLFTHSNTASRPVPIKKKKLTVSPRPTSSDLVEQVSSSPVSTLTGVPPPQTLKKLRVKHAKHPKPKRKGCRCGNATATPGKLTCCGQRCPCYVEAKACIDCRCRGCRNPHRPGGKKVRPIIAEIELNRQKTLVASDYKLGNKAVSQSSVQGDETNSKSLLESGHTQANFLVSPKYLPHIARKTQVKHTSLANSSLNYVVSHTSTLYSTHPPLFVEPVEDVPTTLLVDDEKSDSDNSDIDIDV